MNGWIMLRKMCYVLLLVMRDNVKLEESTGFPMKDSSSAPGLGWRYFKSSGTEKVETIYTYNNKCMGHFIRQSIKGGHVCVFNRYYISKICSDVLKVISEELKVEGNIYDNIETYMN